MLACTIIIIIFMPALLQDGQGLHNSSCYAFSLNMKSDAIGVWKSEGERGGGGREREGGRGVLGMIGGGAGYKSTPWLYP